MVFVFNMPTNDLINIHFIFQTSMSAWVTMAAVKYAQTPGVVSSVPVIRDLDLTVLTIARVNVSLLLE